jgi:hypothetical protein
MCFIGHGMSRQIYQLHKNNKTTYVMYNVYRTSFLSPNYGNISIVTKSALNIYLYTQQETMVKY